MRKFLAGFFSCLAFLGYVGVADAILKSSGGASVVLSSSYPLLAPDGTVGAPSYSLTNSPTTGFYRYGADQFGVSIGGVSKYAFSQFILGMDLSNTITWSNSNTDPLSSAVTSIGSDGANLGFIKNGNSAQGWRVYAGNGGFLANVQSTTESLTIAAAATTTSATSIPAGAILFSCATRVTTVIPTAATFTVTTTTGGTTLQTAAVSTAANSIDPGTAAGASYRAAATTITITPNLTPGTATGVIRLQCYYMQVTPPTS